ncbi:MAG: hypothetical protein A2X61_07615 [Ignavibacteria bacterium GWB2_35_12]|nr:MAG: hypothetical protein A2X63_12915 [Ignavibacteria bacterium GWA2_35_8]OGU39193.1 MAG: hypothetical protein A2X61_07615 [Ignavibacteria bacterium GWB2_35_12]OGU89221.1 MAG: hypothetical protein A2220_01005 [Ignavibacteria bacterium RIFOXYA2_FULL_35_10]OGV21059.1 MAG: hypothetical protein A2475_00905 [Ignavibacteria bacterium RIFOXYC2_FULL_35_21]
MGYFEYLPHTADVRIRAVGSDLADLFDSALKGLCEVIYSEPISNQKLTIKTKINLTSIDSSALIIDFLSEVLLLMYKNKAVFPDIQISKLENNQITAELSGFHIDGFTEDIKAVTYHDAEIITNKENQLEVVITLDI